MSATTIPYHLRHNKAIERNLFADLLMRVARAFNLSDYTYIGFGGPFLEDFKHMHSALRIEKMISIESDENVWFRQVFNLPLTCITLEHMTSGDFLIRHDFDEPTITWLDYASTTIAEQLTETQRLVEKLAHGDIFKITVNANPQGLGGAGGQVGLQAFRRERAIQRLGEYGPSEITEADVTARNYPTLLLSALMTAARHGIQGSRRYRIQPLTAFVYNDGTQMLTFTAIVLDADSVQDFLSKTRLEHWPFACLTGDQPKQISVPSFSVRERLLVESLLPESDVTKIIEKMNYYIGDPESAPELMKNFLEFYRAYPWYSRIVV